MRQIIIIITIFLSTQVSGQNHFIGIQCGVNWTNVITDDFLPDRENRIGFNGGLAYEYHFDGPLFLGTALIYAQKGFTNELQFTDEFGNTISTETFEFNYDYVSIPIKIGVQFGNQFSVFGSLALVPSILVNAETIEPAIEGVQEKQVNDITDRVTTFDFSGIVEIGAKLDLSERSNLFTSVGYQRSFSTITNEDYFADENIFHQGIIISLGLKYAIKKE